LKINGTVDPVDDDVVCVSPAGADRPFATLTVELVAAAGTTKTIFLSRGGDGDITFSDASPSVTVGTPVDVQIYGDAESSAKDSTLVKASFTDGGAAVATETMTVFKGVKIYFSGKFISNVNSRPEGWRPWDAANPPDPPALVAQDIDDYSSTILFQKGDQGKPQRAWAPDPHVVVTKVEAQSPKFDLTTDPLSGAKIYCDSGAFKGNTAEEWFYKPELQFKSDVELLSGENLKPYLTNGTKIVVQGYGGPLTPAESAAATTYINKVADGPTTTLLKDYYKNRILTAVNFRYHIRATWTNSKFRLTKGADGNKSMAVQALMVDQAANADNYSKISLLFTNYEIWDLGGEVQDGILESL